MPLADEIRELKEEFEKEAAEITARWENAVKEMRGDCREAQKDRDRDHVLLPCMGAPLAGSHQRGWAGVQGPREVTRRCSGENDLCISVQRDRGLISLTLFSRIPAGRYSGQLALFPP